MVLKLKIQLTFLCLFLEAHVATVTGEAFGSPNNIRISYAASRKYKKGC